MLDIEKFKTTPMGQAVVELSERLQENGLPPATLNVIGGFAMMMRELRNPNGYTDIDFVGSELSKEFTRISDDIGRKYGLGDGWINRDGMQTGYTVEDFEFSTGKLHFEHAFDIGGITINVLEEEDLLRMKFISIDTSLTAVEQGGTFTRMKDMPDIKILMERQNITPDQLEDRFSEYMIFDGTPAVIQAYFTGGKEGVTKEIAQYKEAYDRALTQAYRERYLEPERTPFMQNLLDNLLKTAQERDNPPTVEKQQEAAQSGTEWKDISCDFEEAPTYKALHDFAAAITSSDGILQACDGDEELANELHDRLEIAVELKEQEQEREAEKAREAKTTEIR